MAWTFDKEQDAYLRSQGWGGTRTDREHHDSFADRDKHIYDSLLKAAGNDKQLTHEEYKTIFNDRGPWGRFAYNSDAIANSLAQLGSQTGIKLDQKTMDTHDLTYSGDDILQKVAQDWDRGPDSRKRDEFKISHERGIADGDDSWNVFRWSSNVQDKEEEEKEVKPVEPEKPKCPAGTRSGANGTCIDDDAYLDFNKDYGDGGSVHYLTPHMRDQYKPKLDSGKFSGFLRANQYQENRSK